MLFRQYLEQYYLEQFVYESAIIQYVQPFIDFVYAESLRFVPETFQMATRITRI